MLERERWLKRKMVEWGVIGETVSVVIDMGSVRIKIDCDRISIVLIVSMKRIVLGL